MENSEMIFAAIVKLAGTRKFMGVGKRELKSKHLKNMDVAELEKGLRFLRNEGKLVNIDGLYFPTGWKPSISSFEEEVVKYLAPCLEEGRKIEGYKVVKSFKTFNEESIKRLLLKLELNERAVKLGEAVYIDMKLYKKLLSLAKKLKKFSLNTFIKESGYKRELCFNFLKYIDGQRLTRFDGEERTII